MAGKPKRMSQIKQLLRLYQSGKSKKEIARILSMSKNTVKSYIAKVENSKMDVKELLDLDDPGLSKRFHPGNPAYKKDRYEHFVSNVKYYLKELTREGVTKQLLWEEYKLGCPEGYSHSQFCFHLQQYNAASKPSMVLNHLPGEKLFIDFAGKKLSYIDPETGEIIDCNVFIACLPYSDYCFSMVVRTQSVEDFTYALTCCLHDLGGAPRALVPDNLKSAVVKADRYEPDINSAMEDFANHYNTTVVPARARKPKDKALVENHVKIIYNRVYARLRNQQFFSLASLNAAVKAKIKAHNQTRMQLRDYCREEKFIADEKHLLSPLPEQAFELKYYKQYKVAQNNHICLQKDKHYYSVPYEFIGKQATVIYTRSLVSIFVEGERAAVHPRNYKKGGYSTIREHLCSAHQHYLERSPEYYMNKARNACPELLRFFELLFQQGRYPEQLYRTCDGLLRLHRNSDAERFAKACQLAIDHEQYSYRFIQNILKNNMTMQSTKTINRPLPKHQNIRGGNYYLNFKQ